MATKRKSDAALSVSDQESASSDDEESPSAAAAVAAVAVAGDDVTAETLKSLLSPLGKDQLIQLLKEAALADPALLTRIAATADTDPSHRKIFVHGLDYSTTTESLLSSFSTYGEIEDCRAVLDRNTNRCKGFGFVLFRTRAAAQSALKEPQKQIGGRETNCQLASLGAPVQHAMPEGTGRKVFVSGVGDDVERERLKEFFGRFGEIEDGPLGCDRETGKFRGFAIFVYKTVEGCKKALEEPEKVFEGRKLSCQRALEGLKPKATIQAGPPPVLQPGDLAMAYAANSMFGVNPGTGILGQSYNSGVGSILGQNAGNGATAFPYGFGMGNQGVGGGMNSASPGVGVYGNPLAWLGSNAQQNSRPSTTPGIGSIGSGMRPYYGR